ncbi:hypothetical protein SGFS_099610 [Streptomyces graminofaciens]|uniref:Uncharacterized protein n=1 Tax=Streptomyces graminofaciens TaxID=68212 RepID=A0ABM7FR75_9ACTN|nr:hypothetical protein SGFS_099610 [Streptomyces graminofaciens]
MLDRLLGVSPGVIGMTPDPLVGAPNGGVTTAERSPTALPLPARVCRATRPVLDTLHTGARQPER